jgi:hypothetical protein
MKTEEQQCITLLGFHCNDIMYNFMECLVTIKGKSKAAYSLNDSQNNNTTWQMNHIITKSVEGIEMIAH